LAPGFYEFDVVIKGADGSGQDVLGNPLRCEARIVDDVEFIPAVVSFGPRSLHQKMEQVVILRSITVTPFEVVGVEFDATAVSVVHTSSDSLESRFSIARESVALGEQSELVEFLIRSGDGGEPRRVPVVLSYFGLGDANSPGVRATENRPLSPY
jgi:hypothetical protein